MLAFLLIHTLLGLSNLVLLESALNFNLPSFPLTGHRFRLLLEQVKRLSLVFCTVNKDVQAFKDILPQSRLKI